MESFTALKLQRWRQFEDIDIDLTPNLCLLTGPNGCGKTTILNVLGKHFGWNLIFLTGSFLTKTEKKHLYGDAWESIEEEAPGAREVGSLSYSSGVESKPSSPTQDQPQYHRR